MPVIAHCPPELVEKVDRRAASLGQSRSKYIVALLRRDTRRGGPLVIEPEPTDDKPRGVGRRRGRPKTKGGPTPKGP